MLDTTGNIKVAQEILGHSHLSTTADLYMTVDQNALVTALVAVKNNTQQTAKKTSATHYAFAYDAQTIDELELAIAQATAKKEPAR